MAYLGFYVPAILAWLSTRWSYPAMFIGGAGVAVACLAVVAAAWRAHLPTGDGAAPRIR